MTCTLEDLFGSFACILLAGELAQLKYLTQEHRSSLYSTFKTFKNVSRSLTVSFFSFWKTGLSGFSIQVEDLLIKIKDSFKKHRFMRNVLKLSFCKINTGCIGMYFRFSYELQFIWRRTEFCKKNLETDLDMISIFCFNISEEFVENKNRTSKL